MQAEGRDPDNSTDLLGAVLPFLYSWTVLGPGGLPLATNLSQSLYTAAALEDGLLQYDADTLPVRFNLIMQIWSKLCGLISLSSKGLERYILHRGVQASIVTS